MEIQEKDTLFFMTLAVFGALLASFLATILHRIIVLPLTLAVFILMIITYFLYKKRVIQISEGAEKWVMILTLLAFIASFIYLYRPV